MSSYLNLNITDVVKGVIVAVIASVLTGVEQIIQTGLLPNLAQLKTIGLAAVIAGVSYLLKNLFTNVQGQLLKADPKIEAPKKN
jgi:hypothetical protein